MTDPSKTLSAFDELAAELQKLRLFEQRARALAKRWKEPRGSAIESPTYRRCAEALEALLSDL